MSFYKFKNLSDDTAEIQIYGEIVETIPKSWWTGNPIDGLFFVSKDFNEQIEKLKNKSKITMRINSPGGDLFVGIGVYNRLKQLKEETGVEIDVIVEGLAASAAGLIACAGDNVRIGTGAVFMAHQASFTVIDSIMETDCETMLNALKACNKAVADILAQKSGKPVEEIYETIKEEIWLTGQEAVDFGVADSLLEEKEPKESKPYIAQNNIYSNGKVFAIKNYIANADKHFSVHNEIDNVANSLIDDEGTKINKEDKPMAQELTITVDALKANYPDIVKDIEGEAVKNAIKNERKRQQEIDEIAPMIADKTALNEAKYGDNDISAEKLLYNAAKASKEKGADFFTAAVADNHTSGAMKIATDPTDTKDDDTVKVKNEIAAAVEIYNKNKEV